MHIETQLKLEQHICHARLHKRPGSSKAIRGWFRFLLEVRDK